MTLRPFDRRIQFDAWNIQCVFRQSGKKSIQCPVRKSIIILIIANPAAEQNIGMEFDSQPVHIGMVSAILAVIVIELDQFPRIVKSCGVILKAQTRPKERISFQS